MGCANSNTSLPIKTTIVTTDANFAVVAQQIKQIWPDVQTIDKFGAKVFTHLLHKYPELRSFYHIPEAYKTEAELLDFDEIEKSGNKFVSLYSDIIEHSDTKYDEIIHEKANELYQQGVHTSQLKYLCESFLHVIEYELQHKLITDEKQSWQIFNRQIVNDLTNVLTKFPHQSILT